MLASSNINYDWYIEFLWWGISILFLYLAFEASGKASKLLAECKSWTKANFGKIGEFRYKLFHRLSYYNIWVLTALILGYLFL